MNRKATIGLILAFLLLAARNAMATEEGGHCEDQIKRATLSSPAWLTRQQDYLTLKDSFEEIARYLKAHKSRGFPITAVQQAAAAIESLQNYSSTYKKSGTHILRIFKRIQDELEMAPRAKSDSRLKEALGTMGEILVSMGLWGLERVQALSGDIYPEKMWLDRAELRSIFPKLIGETDVIFRARFPDEYIAEPTVIRIGEVKTLLKSRGLSDEELRQARQYKDMVEGKKKLGYTYKVYFFFPVASPSPESVKKLQDMGITVVRAQPHE
jgi:hypothetical protein